MNKKANSREQAWEMAKEIFPGNFIVEGLASQNAGYDIYKNTQGKNYPKICDLGNRLEILLGEHGETVINIRIEPQEEIKTDNIYSVEFNGKFMGYSIGKNEYNALKTFGLKMPEMVKYDGQKGKQGGIRFDSWTYTAENAVGIQITVTRAA